jgi:hypothetical protein
LRQHEPARRRQQQNGKKTLLLHSQGGLADGGHCRIGVTHDHDSAWINLRQESANFPLADAGFAAPEEKIGAPVDAHFEAGPGRRIAPLREFR